MDFRKFAQFYMTKGTTAAVTAAKFAGVTAERVEAWIDQLSASMPCRTLN